MSSEPTLNIPQVVVVLVIGFLAVRWYLSKPSTSGSQTRANPRGFRVDPARVDQVAQMFPQADRRSIMWDLQRNGCNVAATTERILGGRPLEQPPLSFQPPLPTSASSSSTTTKKPTHPDLITRYNLSSRINTPSPDSASSATASPASTPSKPIWSTNKIERAQALQRRREEMILAARRKLEEQDKAKKAAA